MRRLTFLLATTLVLCAALMTAAAPAGARPIRTKAAAIAKVSTILNTNMAICEMTVQSMAASSKPGRFIVMAVVTTFGNRGKARWSVYKKTGKVHAYDQLGFEIMNACQ